LDRGGLYLAPFPYSDLTGAKHRPVCVVSTTQFNQGQDVLVAMVTSSRARIQRPGVGDAPLRDWQAAGLLAPSVLRAGRLWTAEQRLLRRQLGALSLADLDAVDVALASQQGRDSPPMRSAREKVRRALFASARSGLLALVTNEGGFYAPGKERARGTAPSVAHTQWQTGRFC
jgi:mRNA interferase MazF